MNNNTAVFYDIKSLVSGTKGSGRELDLVGLYKQISGLEDVDGISVQRAYADWSDPENRNLLGQILHLGIEPVQVISLTGGEGEQNAASISLIIDCIDLAGINAATRNFVIASGSGIYTHLAKKLRERGKRVIGAGFEEKQNEYFRSAVNDFIPLKPTSVPAPKEKKPETAAKEDEKLETPLKSSPEPTPAYETPAPKPVKTEDGTIELSEYTDDGKKRRKLSGKMPTKFPKNAYTDLLVAAKIPVLRDAPKMPLSANLLVVRDIVNALFSKSVREENGVPIKDFIAYMGHHLRGFKIMDNGFKRFDAFMAFLLTNSNYCLYSEDDNVFIAPRKKVTSDDIYDDVDGLSITAKDGKRYTDFFEVPSNTEFTYSVSAKVKKRPNLEEKTPNPGRLRIVPTHNIEMDAPIRSWVKGKFEEFSEEDSLSLQMVSNLTNPAYCKEVLGINVPALIELQTGKSFDEQRSHNGKVLYWSDVFKFNGRTYFIFKEWVQNLHKVRFLNWVASLDK
jgi:hypothetical protein